MNEWFESIAEAERRAQRRLPKPVFAAIRAGSEAGVTYRDNIEAFGELGFAPHIGGQFAHRELATTVMGMDISLPVMLSPTGVQAVHPDGELAVARAAAARSTAMGLSSFGSKPVEAVTAVTDKVMFQMYWSGTREAMVRRMDRARTAGATGLVLTLDWSFSHSRDWGSPAIPDRMDWKTVLSFAPQLAPKPRYLRDWLRSSTPVPDLSVPNLAEPGQAAPTFFGAYGEWMQTPPASWDDIKWLREEWGGPFMLKGVVRVDDATRAVDAGVSCISVSTHGGNNLDGTPGAIRALPGVVEAVGDQVEVILDSGIRRGGDVVKALALGARAVMIGRPYLWGLAANGQAGVENVLDVLRNGIDSALLGLGKASIHDLGPDDVIVPPGFARRLGC
jgi:pre-mycofactocin synthase